ncbi:MAG: DEAD/DEAH box helicase [Candidatus Woesearchaeota archaeon]|jgi:helicase|nr:DEAD/DEAH box helicase [Candidatus Woesearchaeota archaeon]
MKLSDLKNTIPPKISKVLENTVKTLRPAQEKAIKAGLFEDKNLLVCTPTASGKTLIAELAAIKHITSNEGKVIYIVPLKALASEKFREFKKRYSNFFRIALSIGDRDSTDSYLTDYDIIICTAEKLDSLIRHHTPWLKYVNLVVIDEIHLLNDPGRGPTLEILITILRQILKNMQLLGLSATIGNPQELADWLGASLIEDTWRPVKLHKGIYLDGEIEFS